MSLRVALLTCFIGGIVACAARPAAPSGSRPLPPPAPASVPAPAPSGRVAALMAWSGSAPLIAPKSDAKHDMVAVKDPTIVRYGDRYHVYATSALRGGGWNMVYTSFVDFADAAAAPLYFMDRTPGFDRYVAAPQLFYFTPQKKWYLVYQAGPPMFSTADQPADPTRWTAPAPFFATTPAIIEKNGGWLDFWVICDAGACHLFFSDDKGRFYRSTTSVEQFPRGFSEPMVVMADAEAGRLYEACNVYKLASSGKFLALIEAFDRGSESRRYFRSFTADKLDGAWTVLHDGAASPFAGERNVAFAGDPWTRDISHGELVRAGYDEALVLDDRAPLRYLFQGFPPNASTEDYGAIPWSLGLLTQKPGG